MRHALSKVGLNKKFNNVPSILHGALLIMMVYNPDYFFALFFIKTTLSLYPPELLGQNATESVKLPLS